MKKDKLSSIYGSMNRKEILEIYKYEIRRVYRDLGADKGIQKNALEIQLWRNYGFITAEEYHYLRCYSRNIFALMP